MSFLCGHMLSVEIARLDGNSTLTVTELPIQFTQWLYHFPFPPAMHEAPNSSPAAPKFVVVCHFQPNQMDVRWHLTVILISFL